MLDSGLMRSVERIASRRRWVIAALIVVCLALGFAVVAQAQDAGPTVAPARAASGVEDVTADEVNRVAMEIWCPLCSGVRLDTCELKACDQMKEVIAIKLAEGESSEEIRDYFVEQYGPQVLGEPPREGFNWLAWILPFVALIAGGGFMLVHVRRMVRPDEDTAAASQIGDGTEPHSEDNSMEQRLDDELKQYD